MKLSISQVLRLQGERRKRGIHSGNSSTWSSEDEPRPDLLRESAGLVSEQHLSFCICPALARSFWKHSPTCYWRRFPNIQTTRGRLRRCLRRISSVSSSDLRSFTSLHHFTQQFNHKLNQHHANASHLGMNQQE